MTVEEPSCREESSIRPSINTQSHVIRQYCTRIFQRLSLRAQDDQVIEVLRSNEPSKEHLERHGHTGHVGRVARHAGELGLLHFGQEVALVDLDVEGAFSDGLRAALQVWIYGACQHVCLQISPDHLVSGEDLRFRRMLSSSEVAMTARPLGIIGSEASWR